MSYYFCDACKYCFPADTQPDRCPDCGAVEFEERSAVQLASDTEIIELLRIRAEDND